MTERIIEASLSLRQGTRNGCLNLRGDPADGRFREGVAAMLGVGLPLAPCTFNQGADTTLYWLAPDEWLAVMPAGAEAEREKALRKTLRGHFSVVDVSGGYQLFSLEGPAAEEVLRKSSPYDFHLRHFPPGSCAQTVFGKTTALIARHPGPLFILLVRTSYADYVRRWLAAALPADEAAAEGSGLASR